MKRFHEKTTSELPDSINQQLSMYALAASAASVGVLAMVQPADGKIIYTPTHKIIKVHEHYHLDLNHDGITDFTIQIRRVATNGSNLSTLGALFPKHNAVEGGKTNSSIGRGPYAFALQRGALIGPKQSFPANLMALAGTIDGISEYAGQWLHANNLYLGLKFQIRGKTRYGWARLSVVSTKTSITSATLTGYAYETIPNKPIIAGNTKDADEIGNLQWAGLHDTVSSSATLGALAAGSPALSVWRRKEHAVQVR
jgi:hypothetical protein